MTFSCSFYSLFKVVTILILASFIYWVDVVWKVYYEQFNVKPAELIDLPVLSKIFWIPLTTALLLFVAKSRV